MSRATTLLMALPELVELAAVRQVEEFCDSRVPEHARDQVRLEFVVRGNSITLVERRAPWRPDYGPDWSSLDIAHSDTTYKHAFGRSIAVTATSDGSRTRKRMRTGT
jgi:hypothetical protein